MSTPMWRQMYNAWEQAVAPGLEELTASNGFRDVVAMGLRANAELAREVERASRQWLHLWNLPAATDVRKLRKQVSGLEREILALRLELERQARVATPAATRLTSTPTTNGHASADDTGIDADAPVAASNGRSAA